MNAVTEFKQQRTSLIARMADRFGVDPDKMLATLKATAFKQQGDTEVSNEQMMALLVVAEQYHLNPWTKEIYAFPDKKNGIVPVVSVDGWSRIINENPQLDGIEFRYADGTIASGTFKGQAMAVNEWVEAVIKRKDRSSPIVAREFFEEVYRPPFEGKGSNGPYTVNGPWQSHPRRMLRHKALIQCARIAFGFGGIYDQDEAERIVEVDAIVVDSKPALRVDPRGDQSGITDELCEPYIRTITDILNADKEEHEIAQLLREHDIEMSQFPEIAIGVSDRLAKRDICSKKAYKKWLSVGINRGESHT